MDVDVIQAEFKFVVTTIFYVNIHILYICTMYIEAIRCKFSLYLKKAGLASRNIVHHGTKIKSTLYRLLLKIFGKEESSKCVGNFFWSFGVYC